MHAPLNYLIRFVYPAHAGLVGELVQFSELTGEKYSSKSLLHSDQLSLQLLHTHPHRTAGNLRY
ncbi:hypothetical protein CMK13_14580 [Candidatus Poribacteria bacterium]|nr:hypothetical protein [Candidatus Poribacteria bacterium]OUT57653.1 MAG: hypothetical protein CBB75_13940 [bacterium TMED15]